MSAEGTLGERWPTGTAVEIRTLDGWIPATVVGAGPVSALALRARSGGWRVDVRLSTGQRALISEAYNGRANIRAARTGAAEPQLANPTKPERGL